MTEENKTAGSPGWFRSAKDKFRSFAYGEQGEPRERPRVGLALAGGFARGIAHLGVLRVLREAGIPIDCVAGTSVGALIAVGYCAGASLEEMAKVGASTSFTDFGRWTPSWLGLATNQRTEKYLARFTPWRALGHRRLPWRGQHRRPPHVHRRPLPVLHHHPAAWRCRVAHAGR